MRCRGTRSSGVVLLLLAAVSCTLCARRYYADSPADPPAILFSCDTEWCNETWRRDRVLRYNLSVYTVSTENRSEYNGPVFNCEGAQTSNDCVVEGNGTVVTTTIETIVNRTLVSREGMGPEGLLTTDNFNSTKDELEGSYRENQDTIWQIKIPYNCQLWMIFEDFDLEATHECDKDYFSVQTSKSQRDIRKYCKSLESITIQRRKRAQFWFHADEFIQRRGILARYCFRTIVANSSEQRRCDCNQGSSQPRRWKRSEMRERSISSLSFRDTRHSEEEVQHLEGQKSAESRGRQLGEIFSNSFDHKAALEKQFYQNRDRRKKKNNLL